MPCSARSQTSYSPKTKITTLSQGLMHASIPWLKSILSPEVMKKLIHVGTNKQGRGNQVHQGPVDRLYTIEETELYSSHC